MNLKSYIIISLLTLLVCASPLSLAEKTNEAHIRQPVSNYLSSPTAPPSAFAEDDGVSISGQHYSGNSDNPYYPILGYSDKLTPKEWDNLQAWRKDIINVAKKNPDDVFINGLKGKKYVALTFDDGPDNVITPQIIDILKGNNIKATFFFIGEKVEKYPGVAQSAYKNGNLIASHSYDHSNLIELRPEEINSQMKKTQLAIKKAIGKEPIFIRPPFGAVNDDVISMAKKNNLKVIIWSIDTFDWIPGAEVNNIINNVVDNVRNGDIVLMHSSSDFPETPKALREIVYQLKRRGYNFVDIETILRIKAYQ